MIGGSLGANTVTLKTSLTVSPLDEAVIVTVVELLASGWKSRVRVSPSTEAITISGFEDVAVFEMEALSSSTSLNTLERSIATLGAVFRDDKSEIEFNATGRSSIGDTFTPKESSTFRPLDIACTMMVVLSLIHI